MREIKFRAKKKTRKKKYQKWVYGNLYTDIEDCFIMYRLENGDIEFESCIKDTIGQFTGLYDKNNIPIYEGDIIKSLINTFEIVFKKGCFFAVGINREQEYTLFEEFEMCNKANVNLEVIGNIYDNEVEK